ncbi:MAG: crossover junction endodeoxyribonuclease RuvC [Bifidobacteriaceae bacterium]|jgi:crossover junction endodeoxyribonuclease RuvC|nr:crossover junction endodeoxyribonuclease RuvC [Bifidobacteriaceae bacterium]
MRIFGIDPGMTRCGIGVIDAKDSASGTFRSADSLRLYKAGVIRTDTSLAQDERLRKIYDGIDSWLNACKPDVMAVERVFSQENRHSVLGTAQVAGLALLLANQHTIPVSLHTPTEVKATITGFGQANKQQIATMVAKFLKLEVQIKPADASDALAIAITNALKPPINAYKM